MLPRRAQWPQEVWQVVHNDVSKGGLAPLSAMRSTSSHGRRQSKDLRRLHKRMEGMTTNMLVYWLTNK